MIKGKIIYTFKESTFVRSQVVPEFDSIDSALLVRHSVNDSERRSRVYLFQGIDDMRSQDQTLSQQTPVRQTLLEDIAAHRTI